MKTERIMQEDDKAPGGAAVKPEPATPKKVAKKKPQAATGEISSLKTIEELVAHYNEMVLTAVDFGLAVHVAESFPDVKIGQAACEQLHGQIIKARKRNDDMAAKKTKKTKKTRTKKTSSGVKRPRAKLNEAEKIQWIGPKENPCRKGSGKAERVAKIMSSSGKTVGTFVKNGGRVGSLVYCIKKKWIKVG